MIAKTMTDQEQTTNMIDQAAADWVACLDRESPDLEVSARLEAWLAADVRHRGAFARAQAVYAYSERAKVLGSSFGTLPDGLPRSTWLRRSALTVGGLLAASLAALLIVPTFIPEPPPQMYNSQRGEIKLVSLADSSVMTMNTHSRVAVAYTNDRRGVDLQEGEVQFSVAKEVDRPFAVVAGELEVRAVGTSFVVRNIPGRPAEVLVQEGTVDVAYRDAPDTLVRAGANTRITSSEGARLVKVALDPDAVARETAWRQGMIAFEGVSLRTAAQEFSRYSDTHIVIDDGAIANTNITGLFAANNPRGFSEAVAASLGLEVDLRSDGVRIHGSRD